MVRKGVRTAENRGVSPALVTVEALEKKMEMAWRKPVRAGNFWGPSGGKEAG